eukprot:scaffold34686_cov160-Amphora_coffeaeformis.AAC.1
MATNELLLGVGCGRFYSQHSLVGIAALLSLLVTSAASFGLHPRPLPARQERQKSRVENSLRGHNEENDWRSFRANLVGQSTYASGALIEQGSIVLSTVEDTLGCHDLNQPYLHKAVVLVLEHDALEFTQGILLNRPTDLILTDADILYDGAPVVADDGNNDDKDDTFINAWHMHFGGDLAGLFDEERQAMICCLYKTNRDKNSINHPHQNDDAGATDVVLQDLHVTSHAAACEMIKTGRANIEDFYAFYGFCGWEPGQLERELKRGSWTMVTTTADTVWAQLSRQRRRHFDPREAGLSMWEYFTDCICKDSSNKGRNTFSDLMLKAWTTEHLCLARHEDDHNYFDFDISTLLVSSNVEPGDLFRASHTNYLLGEQYLHKAVVLILQELDEASIGLVLNIPTADTFTLTTPKGRQVGFFIRYGGASGKNGKDPLLWLHCSQALRKASIGSPLSNQGSSSRIYLCTVDDVMEAIDLDLAFARDFMLIQGFTVWEKLPGEAGGMSGEIRAGHMYKVASQQTDNIWSLLQSQDCLMEQNLDQNLRTAFLAWTLAGRNNNTDSYVVPKDEIKIFDSNVSEVVLADEALGVWMKIFLLGDAEYAPS